jgi:hypothetical protein
MPLLSEKLYIEEDTKQNLRAIKAWKWILDH